MRQRYLVSLIALAGVFTLASLAVVSITGQTPASPAKSTPAKSSGAAKAGTSARTPWGDPDLQGTWFVLYDVPLERSAANAGKPLLTDEEVAAANKQKGLNPGRNMRSPMRRRTLPGPTMQSSTPS